ncbi:MAG: DinB family protein, partial [Pyrinomonadaceae bacterium]
TLNSDFEKLKTDAIKAIDNVLDFLENVPEDKLFEERFVGREKLSTNVFGLLFHTAEHTARHVGQFVTTAKIVKIK